MSINKSDIYEKLMSFKNPNHGFDVFLTLSMQNRDIPNASVYIGDSVKIKFESSQDCYLTLIDIGTSGKASVIVPSFFNIDNFVKAGKSFYIPDGGTDVAAVIQGPAGTERLKAFATSKPLNLFDIDFRYMTMNSFSLGYTEFTEKIEMALKKLKNEDFSMWADAALDLNIKVQNSFPPVM